MIFTGKLDFNVRWNVVSLANQFPATHFTIFLHQPKKKPGRLVLNQFRNLRRHGWRWVPYQLREIVSIAYGKIKSRPEICPDSPGQMFTPHALQNHPRISIKPLTSINGNEACDHLKEISADLGIALGAPILKRELFEIPRLGTINLHKGRLPNYRGMPPAFWELHNGEKEVGCTVHRVDAGLDSGDILLESSVSIDAFSTVSGLQTKLHHRGVDMICQAVKLIAAGEANFKKQQPGGATNTRPSLGKEKTLSQELARKQAPDGGMPKEMLRTAIKRTVFFLYASALMPVVNAWHGTRKEQRVIILLYHRVSDEFRDNVTIGIEQFDRQMAYVAENFITVSLKEIVEGKISRDAKKPVIAVSFDDGYLDNFENAAPILLKHQVPCTFFISTEKIRDNKPFDHDLKALGFGLNNMSWDQVKQMSQWGFHFGSHTLNHVNLAAVDEDVALHELTGSLNDIRAQLGQENVYIAYPYGRKQHITRERIALMKQVGYSACFSAYGGCNDTDIDLFDVKRIGINWAFDSMAFNARLRGWDKTA